MKSYVVWSLGVFIITANVVAAILGGQFWELALIGTSVGMVGLLFFGLGVWVANSGSKK